MIVLTPWVWGTDIGGEDYWGPPSGTLPDWLDMRAQDAESQFGGTPGMLLCALDPAADIPRGSIVLGDDLNARLSAIALADLASAFGVDKTELDAATMFDAIWEMRWDAADVTHANRSRPFLANPDGTRYMKFAGQERTDTWEWGANRDTDLLKQMLRFDHAQLKVEYAESKHYEEILGSWMLKYRQTAEELVPGEISRTPHTTTDTETFDGTGAFGGVLSWTQFGSLDNIANQGNGITADTDMWGRADVDLGGNDIDSTITYEGSSTDDRIGSAVRYSSVANTCYYAWTRALASATYRIYKVAAGVPSELANNSTTPSAIGSVMKLTILGNAREFFDDGVSKLTESGDSSITTGVRAGAYWYSTGGTNRARADNFFATDNISAGAAMINLAGYGGLASPGGYGMLAGAGGGLVR